MTQEAQKDFNAMLRQPRDMPRVQTVTDPGGIPAQRALLEAEGHTVVSRGRTRLRWFVRDYERSLFPLSE